MLHRIPLTKARINLGQLVRRIAAGNESFLLEKDGIPVAGLVGLDELGDYSEQHNTGLKKQIAAGYKEYRKGKAADARSLLATVHAASVPKKKRKSR